MKYVDENGSPNVDRRKASVQGVENYFTDSLLYQDFLEADENPSQKNQTLVMTLMSSQRQKKNVLGS